MSGPRGRVVVVGSLNTDLVFKVARAPEAGETLAGSDFARTCGGKGANQAVAATRAGASALMVGRVGDDPFGEEQLRSLAAHGVDTAGILRDPEAVTGVAGIVLEASGQNRIVVVAGANGRVGAADLERARGALAAADVIVTQLEIPLPAVEQLAALARELDKRLILNPAPAPAGPLPEGVMASAYVITPNESEAERMSGVRVDGAAGAARAAAELRRQGARRVIITLGGEGLYGVDESGTFRLPAHPVEIVDTVGAGDAFTGALAAALAEGQSLAAGCRFASAAAALSVTRPGAQDAMPDRGEIERFLEAL